MTSCPGLPRASTSLRRPVEDVTSDFLQWFFVLDNENYRPAFQFPSARPQTEPVPPPNAREGEMFKSEHNERPHPSSLRASLEISAGSSMPNRPTSMIFSATS